MKSNSNLNDAFIQAIKKKKVRVIETFLQKGQVDISTPVEGFYPLHEAVRANSPEIVELLLAYGANCSHKDPKDTNERTPIHLAAYEKKWDCVLKFTQYKAEERNNVIGYAAALGFAVSNKKVGVVEALLKAGAPPSLLYYTGGKDSYLHEAVWVNSPEILDLLLAYGADYSSQEKNSDGKSPAKLAGWFKLKGGPRFDCFPIFAKYPAEKDPDGYALLLLRAVTAKKYQVAFDLLSAGAAPTYAYEGDTKDTVLHEAVHNNNPHLVSLLVHHYQADTTIRNKDGQTPLDLARDIATKTGNNDCLSAFSPQSAMWQADQFCKALLRGEAADPTRIDKKLALIALKRIAVDPKKHGGVFTLLEKSLDDALTSFQNETKATLPLAKLIRQKREDNWFEPRPGQGQWFEFARFFEALKTQDQKQEDKIAFCFAQFSSVSGAQVYDPSSIRKAYDRLIQAISGHSDENKLKKLSPSIQGLLSQRLYDCEKNDADLNYLRSEFQRIKKLAQQYDAELESKKNSPSTGSELPPAQQPTVVTPPAEPAPETLATAQTAEPAAIPTVEEEKTEEPASPLESPRSTTTAAINQALPVVETETRVEEEKPYEPAAIDSAAAAEPASPVAAPEPTNDPVVITIPSPQSSHPAESVSLPEPEAEEKQPSGRPSVGLFTPPRNKRLPVQVSFVGSQRRYGQGPSTAS